MSMVDFVKNDRCNHEQMVKNVQMPDSTEPDDEFLNCEKQLNRARDKLICKSKVTGEYQGDVVPACTLPCSFYSYETDRSTSTWPTKSWQLAWLNTSIGRTVLKMPEMSEYRRAIELLNHSVDVNETTTREVLHILERNNALERNLLAITVVRPNWNLHKVAEKEVFSLTSFLSQTGGLLSIWIGLTMICVVEVLELIINCCCVYMAKRRENQEQDNNSKEVGSTQTQSPVHKNSKRNKHNNRKKTSSSKEDDAASKCVVVPLDEYEDTAD